MTIVKHILSHILRKEEGRTPEAEQEIYRRVANHVVLPNGRAYMNAHFHRNASA